MVGLFINTLPVRVRVSRRQRRAGAWLARAPGGAGGASARTSTRRSSDVQAWSEVPRGTPLFESLVVFENYPTTAPAPRRRELDVDDAAPTTRRPTTR